MPKTALLYSSQDALTLLPATSPLTCTLFPGGIIVQFPIIIIIYKLIDLVHLYMQYIIFTIKSVEVRSKVLQSTK